MIRKIWENTFNEEGRELLESTKEDVEQIIDLFIADKIDPQIFLSNLEVLLQIDTPYLKEAAKSAKPASYSILNPPKTRGGISFWSFVNKPPAIPLWFLAAYPDIIVWWDEQQEKHHRNTDDGAIEFIKLFGMREDTEDFRNNKGKARPKYLKNLIQSYKEITGKEIEAIVKNLEDDIYAGAEFLKILGSESNFTFVAENTAKYYLELSKNYSTRFNNEASLLATAGILDAKVYIFMQQKINPADIIDVAKKLFEVEKEPLVSFVICLEVLLFKLDNPNMSFPAYQFKSMRELIGIKE